jgi:hypothetical protein
MDDDPNDRAAHAKRGSPYLNTDQAAYFLGVSRRHLERLRARKEGPKCRRHSQMFQYHIDDLIAWSEALAKGSGS